MRRHILLFISLLAVSVLSGCATRGGLNLPDMADWETRKAVLGQADEWEFTGRIGVSAADEGFNGKLFWQQQRSYSPALSVSMLSHRQVVKPRTRQNYYLKPSAWLY